MMDMMQVKTSTGAFAYLRVSSIVKITRLTPDKCVVELSNGLVQPLSESMETIIDRIGGMG